MTKVVIAQDTLTMTDRVAVVLRRFVVNDSALGVQRRANQRFELSIERECEQRAAAGRQYSGHLP